MLDDWNFAAVISTSGAATLADFVLGGLSFWGENPRSCTWQWWLPSRFLVEGIVWRLDLVQGENPGSNYDGWTGRR